MAQYFPQKPAAIPLIAALATSSYYLHGNIGALTTGVIPYVTGRSSPYEVVRAINWFIEKGKFSLFPSGVLSSALFGCAAYFASDLRVQQLSTVAAVSALAMVPYTGIVMLPTNKAFAEIETGGAPALKGKEDKALEKVETWKAQHMVRIVLGAVGWVAGIMALEIL